MCKKYWGKELFRKVKTNRPHSRRKQSGVRKKNMSNIPLNISCYQDALEIMEAMPPQTNVCKCGKVINHGNKKNPWFSLWCPEYRAYLKSKPKSKLDLVMEKKHRAIDNNLFAQALGVIL